MNLFEKAFHGKTYQLLHVLDVSIPLLCLLRDKELLTYLQVESLNVIEDKSKKVEELLQILRRLDDSKFDVFCSVLVTVGQPAIVKIIRPDAEPTQRRSDASQYVTELSSTCVPREQLGLTVGSEQDRQTIELEETIEVDYGLPVVLHGHKVLTSREWQHIAQHHDVHRREVQIRVSRLLEFAVQTLKSGNESMWSALKNTSFQDSLHETKQPHIANFIMTNGVIDTSRFCDVCPLNEQQRISLLPRPDVTVNSSLNSQDRTLLDMLLTEGVISSGQQEYISEAEIRGKSNERLLLIMKRRSVADVKTFFRCLLKMGCSDVVDRLNKPGIFVPIHTTINSKTMTNEDKRKRENVFVKFFKWLLGKPDNSELYPEAFEAVTCLQKRGCDLYPESKQSIAWYIHCQTQDSLDSLRHMYDSDKLAQVLHVIFNSGLRDQEPLPLRLEWRAGKYEFYETSSQPFGSFFGALSTVWILWKFLSINVKLGRYQIHLDNILKACS